MTSEHSPPGFRRSPLPRGRVARLSLAVAAAFAALVVLVALEERPVRAGAAEGDLARVDAGGRCLNLRAAPGEDATRLTCLPHGTIVTLLSDEVVPAGDHDWRHVAAGDWQGWVAQTFLAFDVDDAADDGRSTDGLASITYYYCEQGENPAAWGDGGGFCGTMRSGEPVYEGAAACAAENFGQRFRIAGDPLDLVYTCEDTGSAVGGDHRDIWFQNSDDGAAWIAAVGYHAEVIVVDGDDIDRHGHDEDGADEPPPAAGFSPEPSMGGLTLATFHGPVDALSEHGTALGLVTCFATVDGAFVGYTFGAPAFLNASFASTFEGDLAGRPLICRRG